MFKPCVLSDLDRVCVVNLEDVREFGRGRSFSRRVSYWVHSLIRRKVARFAEERGVRVVLQNSRYRSQRCSGWVKKSNRRGELFLCSGCGFRIDTDLNAARNHEQNLPPVGFLDNRVGFFWLSGGSLQSPLLNSG